MRPLRLGNELSPETSVHDGGAREPVVGEKGRERHVPSLVGDLDDQAVAELNKEFLLCCRNNLGGSFPPNRIQPREGFPWQHHTLLRSVGL